MSEEGAMEALLARLSYQATVRAGEAAKRAANRFPVNRVAKIAFVFCILVSISTVFLFCKALSKFKCC